MGTTPIAAVPVRPAPRRLRSAFAVIALAVLPVAAAVVILVLHAMGPAAAGVTGGCGGG